MKTPAILAALALLSACAETTKSVETPASPVELNVAAAPEADATCAHGAIEGDRSFVLCEDGRLRKAGVVGALETPVDAKLDIEEVAKRYSMASQVFTGIELATYGNLIRKDRRPAKPITTRRATQFETVTIEGKVYDVYHLGIGEKSGTIFVERKAQ